MNIAALPTHATSYQPGVDPTPSVLQNQPNSTNSLMAGSAGPTNITPAPLNEVADTKPNMAAFTADASALPTGEQRAAVEADSVPIASLANNVPEVESPMLLEKMDMTNTASGVNGSNCPNGTDGMSCMNGTSGTNGDIDGKEAMDIQPVLSANAPPVVPTQTVAETPPKELTISMNDSMITQMATPTAVPMAALATPTPAADTTGKFNELSSPTRNRSRCKWTDQSVTLPSQT